MFTIYVYVLDTLADWEIGYVTSELNSGRFFKKDANRVSLKTVSYSKESIKTMGGMTIVPDCVIDDIVMSETSVLLLPGADTWNNLEHKAIIEKASELLALNATVLQFVELQLHLRIMVYWIIGHTQVMEQGFWKCSLLVIKGKVRI